MCAILRFYDGQSTSSREQFIERVLLDEAIQKHEAKSLVIVDDTNAGEIIKVKKK